jgi:transposase
VPSEAAFAALAGTCPVPASSGSSTRFRLNRGGDRQLNKAVYTIALIRMNRDPATKDYVAKRTGQGRTKKEIIRSLKRYITRQIYRTLNAAREVGNIELKPVVAPT